MRTEADRQALLALYDAQGPEASYGTPDTGDSDTGDGPPVPPCAQPGPQPVALAVAPPTGAPPAGGTEAESAAAGLQPGYSVGRRWLQVGHAWLERGSGLLPEAAPLQVLHSQLRPLQALVNCVRMRWLCILTGASGCGKTSLARLLAQLSAHRLSEVMLRQTYPYP